MRKASGGFLCVAAMGGCFVYFDESTKTLGIKRNLKFWVRAFPMYLHYRVTEELVKSKSDEEAAAAYNRYEYNIYDTERESGRESESETETETESERERQRARVCVCA